jgi:hypothetical protein
MISCNKSINDLEKDNVSFNSLPVEVKECFYKMKETEKNNVYPTELVNLDTIYRYQLKTVKTVTGPWISHYLLIDETNNISYKIDFGVPFPIIVFDRKIFIPQVFNLFSVYKDKFETLDFDVYLLE